MEKQEQVRQIKELLQHPAWALYKSLSQAWRQQKHKEQADILRQCNSATDKRVLYIQGEIDGSLYTESLLEDCKNSLTADDGEGNNPAY